MSKQPELLYERARALRPELRRAFIEDACRGDPQLSEELLSLLAQADSAESFFAHLSDAVFSRDFSTSDGSTLASPSDPATEVLQRDPDVGRTVGHYRILSRIGAGGMGTVYRAQDTRLNRDVALKFLPAHLSAELVAQERLLVEARAAAALEHPNVCSVHEIAETDDGRPFIVMALCAGETLKERLRRGSLTPEEALDIAAQIARGLGAAHAHGIVHRDVKPGNVMLGTDGTVKLLDFGLAKVADTTITRPGLTPGTIPYMSPEHARGDPVDQRADLWSLGVVLYEMLAGTRPFRGGNDRVLLQAILHEPCEPLAHRRPELPDGLTRIVDQLLRKEPDARYGSAGELLAAFADARSPGPREVPANEPQRIAALLSYGILDTPPEATYDELTELAARLCQTPVAYIKFIDDTRAWFKSKIGFPPEFTQLPREASLCNATICQADLVIIPDCSVDDRFRDHPTVTGWPNIRFYCAMPLIDAGGYALGTFCVFDYVPREISFDQQEAVRTLANQVVRQLELRRLSTQLSRALVDLERARHDIEHEQAKSQALLYDILPREIAEEFKTSGRVQPRYYPLATVLFGNFHDFNRFTTSMEPARLVQTLDEYFTAFDGIVEQHRLEKIKTIGDCYLCAGGVPAPSRSHIVDGCLAALAMQAHTERISREHDTRGRDRWQMRIGIHAGPVMTGVVGRRKVSYDIWGDVVKVAQRIEAAAEPGRITISEPIYQRVRHLFDIDAAGTIEIRDRGRLPIYFLNRIKPELSADAAGQVANADLATWRLRLTL